MEIFIIYTRFKIQPTAHCAIVGITFLSGTTNQTINIAEKVKVFENTKIKRHKQKSFNSIKTGVKPYNTIQFELFKYG